MYDFRVQHRTEAKAVTLLWTLYVAISVCSGCVLDSLCYVRKYNHYFYLLPVL